MEDDGVNLFGYLANTPINTIDLYGLLVWNTNPAQWDDNLQDGQTKARVPGQQEITIRGSLAVTVIKWTIEARCTCIPGDKSGLPYLLDEITVNYYAAVSMRKAEFYKGVTNQRHIKNQSKRDWVIQGEQEHVDDFDKWANTVGKPIAKSYETDDVKIFKKHFATYEACTVWHEAELAKALKPTASVAVYNSEATRDGFLPRDIIGRPHTWKGTNPQ